MQNELVAKIQSFCVQYLQSKIFCLEEPDFCEQSPKKGPRPIVLNLFFSSEEKFAQLGSLARQGGEISDVSAYLNLFLRVSVLWLQEIYFKLIVPLQILDSMDGLNNEKV